jgi:serine/threonine protein kinase
MHGLGFLHRDLKPAVGYRYSAHSLIQLLLPGKNILVFFIDSEGHLFLKLCDFGLSGEEGDPVSYKIDSSITPTSDHPTLNQIIGLSTTWAPPELALDVPTYTHLGDAFSVGAIMFFMYGSNAFYLFHC